MYPNLQVGLRNATTALSALSSRKQKDYAEQIRLTLGRIREVVVALVEVYAKTFRVNFSLAANSGPTPSLLHFGSDLDGSAPTRHTVKGPYLNDVCTISGLWTPSPLSAF